MVDENGCARAAGSANDDMAPTDARWNVRDCQSVLARDNNRHLIGRKDGGGMLMLTTAIGSGTAVNPILLCSSMSDH